MECCNEAILYRAHRLRFAIGAVFLLPFTVGIAALAYDGIYLGDSEVRGGWLTVPLLGLYLWFDYIILAKLIRPPELEVSLSGIRWNNDAMLQWDKRYSWNELDGPQQSAGANGVPLLQLIVKSTGRKLRLPPSHFGASYDEMAAVISAARDGRLIAPAQWRAEHPPHLFKHWLLDCGLPISLGVVAVALMEWFSR